MHQNLIYDGFSVAHLWCESMSTYTYLVLQFDTKFWRNLLHIWSVFMSIYGKLIIENFYYNIVFFYVWTGAIRITDVFFSNVSHYASFFQSKKSWIATCQYLFEKKKTWASSNHCLFVCRNVFFCTLLVYGK